MVITFVSEIGEQLCEFHFRVPGLKAAGHRPFDQMLRLCGAHAVAKEIGIAPKVFERRQGDRVDAVLNDDLTGSRKRSDPVCQCSDELIERVGR